VEVRHWILKGSIPLQLGEESVVRDHGFVAAFGDDGEIGQIFEEFFVVADGKHNSRTVAVFVREILQGLAHDTEATLSRH